MFALLLAPVSVPVTDLLALAQSHAWLAFSALLIGLVVRMLKDDAFILPASWSVAAKYRPLVAAGLGLVSGVLDTVVRGTPWRDAIVGGLLAALVAMLGHTGLVDVLRGGRDIGVPDLTPTEPAAPQRPPVTIEFRANIPPSASSDEVTWPKGPPTPRNDKPRGVAQVRVLVVLALLTAIPLSPALHVAGCAGWWTQNKARVVHTFRAITGVCTGFAVSVPEVGPVCLALDQVDRLLEVLAAAQRDRDSVRLRIEIGDVTREVTVSPDQVGALLSHVGQVSSAGHAAPAASGSAVPR